jgi:2-oxoglutarate ferredoxin oxidoreductase subunit beta
LEEDKPLIFGANKDKGIRLNGLDPEIVTLGDGVGQDDLLIHQPRNPNSAYANILAQMTYPTFPTPVGVLRQLDGRETYEDALVQQIEYAQSSGSDNLQELLTGQNSWVVEG